MKRVEPDIGFTWWEADKNHDERFICFAVFVLHVNTFDKTNLSKMFDQHVHQVSLCSGNYQCRISLSLLLIDMAKHIEGFQTVQSAICCVTLCFHTCTRNTIYSSAQSRKDLYATYFVKIKNLMADDYVHKRLSSD